MGLLDDAIREHLELKRLGGADPGDVAREEQAALGSVRRGGEANGDESLSSAAESPSVPDHSKAGQETVEINMEEELSSAESESQPPAPGFDRAAPVARPAHGQAAEGDSLEWEVPGESSSESADSQDDAQFGGDDNDDERVEDVLEETPDFLRDTPEQERLWFEQRPPRDFDFNE